LVVVDDDVVIGAAGGYYDAYSLVARHNSYCLYHHG
jgi:hypothetical protein